MPAYSIPRFEFERDLKPWEPCHVEMIVRSAEFWYNRIVHHIQGGNHGRWEIV